MDEQRKLRRVDISAAIRRFKAIEQMRRARRRVVIGLALVPASCLFAVTRYRPDFVWAPAEVAIVTPMLLISAALVLTGVLGSR